MGGTGLGVQESEQRPSAKAEDRRRRSLHDDEVGMVCFWIRYKERIGMERDVGDGRRKGGEMFCDNRIFRCPSYAMCEMKKGGGGRIDWIELAVGSKRDVEEDVAKSNTVSCNSICTARVEWLSGRLSRKQRNRGP